MGFAASCSAASLKIPDDRLHQLPSLIRGTLDFSRQHAWWLVFAASAGLGIFEVLRRWIGFPNLWPTLHKVSDEFREEVFSDAAIDPVHEHRVTLFKRVPWSLQWPCCCRPWRGWLIPVVRSGHTTQSTSTVFPAPDDATKAEGIAGEAWKGRFMWIENLPDVSGDAPDDDIRLFAETTRVSEKWVRKHHPNRRSYGGFIVEVRGKPWGVIVLDSTSPTGLKHQKRKACEAFAKNVGRILEGAQR